MAVRLAHHGYVRTRTGIYIPLPAGTGAVEPITDLGISHEVILSHATAITAIAGTGSGATRTLRVVKGASTVAATGTVTLASQAAVGGLVSLDVTGGEDSTFRPGDTLTVDFPSGGTAFTAGAINFIMQFLTKAQTPT